MKNGSTLASNYSSVLVGQFAAERVGQFKRNIQLLDKLNCLLNFPSLLKIK